MNAEELKDRMKRFAVGVIRFTKKLARSLEMDVISKQLIRSSCSMAANYRACDRAKSHADFIAKMGIVEEESDETLFWLEILEDLGVPNNAQLLVLKKRSQRIAVDHRCVPQDCQKEPFPMMFSKYIYRQRSCPPQICNPQSAICNCPRICNPQSAINACFAALVLTLITAVAFAAESAGTRYSFLDLQISPRTQSLGSAAAALIGDGSAMLSNPAALACQMANRVEAMQTQPIFDSNYYLLSAALEGGWGVAWSQQTVTDISLTSTTSASATSDVLAEGSSTYVANAVTLARGFQVSESLSAGLSVAGFYQDFSNVSLGRGYGASLSLGFLLKADGLLLPSNIGFVLKDLANVSRWDTGTWETATPQLQLGGLWSFTDSLDVLIEARRNFSLASPTTLHTGAEFRLFDFAALRTGWDDGVITAGMGLMLGFVGLDASYESASDQTLAERVRVGVNLQF